MDSKSRLKNFLKGAIFAAGIISLSVANAAENITAAVRAVNGTLAGSGSVFSGDILTVDSTGSTASAAGSAAALIFDGNTHPKTQGTHWHVSSPGYATVKYIISDDWRGDSQIVAEYFRLYCCCDTDYPKAWAFYGSNTPEDENSWQLLASTNNVGTALWLAANSGYIELSVPVSRRAAYRAYKFENTASNGGWCRFAELEIYGDILPGANTVCVEGAPQNYGIVSPPYGDVFGVEPGAEIEFSASQEWVDETGVFAAQCAGYAIFSAAFDPAGASNIVTEVASGAENSFVYTHSDSGAGIIRWNWLPAFRLQVSATPNCNFAVFTNSVSAECAVAADSFIPEGTTVFALAQDSAGGDFYKWAGDVNDLENPSAAEISFVMDAPRSIRAMFRIAADFSTDKLFIGANNGLWDAAENWLPAGVPLISDNVYIPQGKRVNCALGNVYAASLTISNNAALSIFGSTTAANEKICFTEYATCYNATVNGRHAADTLGERSAPVVLDVMGDVRVLGSGELLVGGHFQYCRTDVKVGGNFALEGSASFDVYSGASAAFPAAGITEQMRVGGRVFVGGEMSLAAGARVRAFCHMGAPEDNIAYFGTGAAVFFELDSLEIAQNANFISDMGISNYSTPDIRPLGRPTSDNYGGAGHGGIGGNGATGTSTIPGVNGGGTYGSEIAPNYPGGHARSLCSIGGGVIRINARALTLAGNIDATPSDRVFGRSMEYGGGAGGSIWITLAEEPSVAETGRFIAMGGNGYYAVPHSVGGGGGGRIAVEVGLGAEDISALYNGEVPECCQYTTSLSARFPGAVNVGGGVGGYLGSSGAEGSAIYCQKLGGVEMTFIIKTEPLEAAAVGFSPSLGLMALGAEDSVEATAPEAIFVNAAESERRICSGWKLTDATGETLLASGEGCVASFNAADFSEYTTLVLTWDFSELQHRARAQVAGSGTVVGTGWVTTSTESVTFSANGAGFKMWLADSLATREELTQKTATIACRGPIDVVAVFADAANSLQTKTFIGASGDIWENDANWNPAGVPTLADAVVIPAGKIVALGEKAFVGSLTIADGAGVSAFGATTALAAEITNPAFLHGNNARYSPLAGRSAANDETSLIAVGIFCAGDLTINGSGYLALGGVYQQRPSILAIGGDFRANDTARLSIHAGPVRESHGNDIILGGSRMIVGGKAHFAGASTNYFRGHFGSEATPEKQGSRSATVLDAGSVVVEAEASILAHDGTSLLTAQIGDDGFNGDHMFSGTGHGGIGGAANGQKGGGTFDSPYAPLLPGNYGRTIQRCEIGGGVVRIVTDSLTLRGTLDASATIRDHNYESGGASGGSVQVIASNARIEPTARVLARGCEGQVLYDTGAHIVGGGGGGRVSFLVGLKAADISRLLGGENYRPNGATIFDLNAAEDFAASPFAGTIDVSGGIGRNGGNDGGVGTAFFIQGKPRGTLFFMR